MAAEPGAPLPDPEFTQCVQKCHEALNQRISYACIQAWQDAAEGPSARQRRGPRAPADASIVRATAIIKSIKKKEASESVHSEEQCHLSSSELADLLRTRGGSLASVGSVLRTGGSSVSSVGSGLRTGGSSVSSVGSGLRTGGSSVSSADSSLPSVKIIRGPGVHHKASSSSISSSCDTATRLLEQCLAELSRSSTHVSQLVYGQETIGAVPHLHAQASGSGLSSLSGSRLSSLSDISSRSSSGSSSGLLSGSSSGLSRSSSGLSGSSGASTGSSSGALSSLSSTVKSATLAMHEDYGNYYAANMQPMNGLHLYDLNEIHECQMNLEQCQQSQHSLFLLDGVLLLTLVSLSFIGLLCVVCLCIVIIGRYIPFNQRKSGYVSYQNADTEIGNL
eukprot:522636_1